MTISVQGYERQFYQIANRIEKSIRQRESNRIELFFPESECSSRSLTDHSSEKKWDLHLRRPCVEVLDKHSLRRLRLS